MVSGFCLQTNGRLRIAFDDYNIFRGFEGSEFVSLKNFVDFLTGRDFIRVFKNTLMISFWQDPHLLPCSDPSCDLCHRDEK